MSEWIKWAGGKCPVDKGVLVDVMYRDGKVALGLAARENVVGERRGAGFAFWYNDSSINDIVAYRLTTQEEAYEETEKPIDSALNVQIGGDHYKKLKIQPAQYNHANNIPFLEGNAIKYITRWRDKGGITDLKKAIHDLQMLIELEGK